MTADAGRPDARSGRLRRMLGSGLMLVSASTALAGLVGYVITWLVPRQIGFAQYPTFAAFWAFVFLLAAALSGIQQEITRGTHPRPPTVPRSRQPWLFTLVASVAVTAVVVASAPLWVQATFPEEGYGLVIPLAVGAFGYIWVAAITGTLYGLTRWRELFWIVVCEASVRVAGVVTVLAVSPGIVALAWVVVVPFIITATVLAVVSRRQIFGGATLDVGPGLLTANVARTLLAAASLGMLISGFPLVVSITSQGADPTEVGLVILTSTLVRAPLIVTAMALQSYLIVHFRARSADTLQRLFRILGCVVGAGIALAIVGLVAGPPVFALLFPDEPVPNGWFIAALIGSSALVSCLCVTAPAVLARAAHSVYTAGWLTAAVVTVGILLLPLELVPRVLTALSVAPSLGVIVHLVYLSRPRGRITPRRPLSLPGVTGP